MAKTVAEQMWRGSDAAGTSKSGTLPHRGHAAGQRGQGGRRRPSGSVSASGSRSDPAWIRVHERYPLISHFGDLRATVPLLAGTSGSPSWADARDAVVDVHLRPPLPDAPTQTALILRGACVRADIEGGSGRRVWRINSAERQGLATKASGHRAHHSLSLRLLSGVSRPLLLS